MEFISYDDEAFLNNAFRTKSPAMARAFEKIRSVAPTKCTVLLLGETGSGKGVVARLIHACSNRKSAHFVSAHCGATPDPAEKTKRVSKLVLTDLLAQVVPGIE